MKKLNLQFFADEAEVSAGENVTEIAEPSETEASVDSGATAETTEQQTTEQPAVDMNAIYAAARRKAEADAKVRQDKIDAEFANRFSGYKNPLTGEPIRSQSDYLAAIDAQQQLQTENELRAKGVDPSLISQLVNNNPVVKQANEVVIQAQKQSMINRISQDIAELGTIDPSIKSIKDVPQELIDTCKRFEGMNLVEAYKLLNYGKVTAEKADAIRQSTINQVKGKQHLQPVNGISTPDSGVEIPANELKAWQIAYPDLSAKELKKKYNQTL